MPSPETTFQQCKLIILLYVSNGVTWCVSIRFENYSARIVVDKTQVILELYDTAGIYISYLYIAYNYIAM